MPFRIELNGNFPFGFRILHCIFHKNKNQFFYFRFSRRNFYFRSYIRHELTLLFKCERFRFQNDAFRYFRKINHLRIFFSYGFESGKFEHFVYHCAHSRYLSTYAVQPFFLFVGKTVRTQVQYRQIGINNGKRRF